MNLVGNALKFTEHGEVHVACASTSIGSRDGTDGSSQRLLVRASPTRASASPPTASDRLFKRFSPGRCVDHPPLRRHRPGLAICKQPGRADGRRDRRAQSEPAAARTFWFTPAAARRAVRDADRCRRDVHDGRRVLVVDDKAINRAILREQLTSWRVEHDVRRRRRRALAALRDAAARGRPVSARAHRSHDAGDGRPDARPADRAPIRELDADRAGRCSRSAGQPSSKRFARRRASSP